MNEYIFIWLNDYININYLEYLYLIKYFNSVKNIYDLSLNKNKFYNYINYNNIKIENQKIEKFCNLEIKKKSKLMFDYLKSNKIVILTINSKKFPINLNNVLYFNYIPLVIYVRGELSNLNKTFVNMFYNEEFSLYGKNLYIDFCKYLKLNNVYTISTKNDENLSIIVIDNILDFKKYINGSIILSCFLNYREDSNLYKYSIINNMSNLLLIIEAGYNYNCVMNVDYMLESGKDIYVIPRNIYEKSSYFSNYLIYLGANVVTSKYQFLKEIRRKND